MRKILSCVSLCVVVMSAVMGSAAAARDDDFIVKLGGGQVVNVSPYKFEDLFVFHTNQPGNLTQDNLEVIRTDGLRRLSIQEPDEQKRGLQCLAVCEFHWDHEAFKGILSFLRDKWWEKETDPVIKGLKKRLEVYVGQKLKYVDSNIYWEQYNGNRLKIKYPDIVSDDIVGKMKSIPLHKR